MKQATRWFRHLLPTCRRALKVRKKARTVSRASAAAATVMAATAANVTASAATSRVRVRLKVQSRLLPLKALDQIRQ